MILCTQFFAGVDSALGWTASGSGTAQADVGVPASFHIHPVTGEAIQLQESPQFEIGITKDKDSAGLGTHRAPTRVIAVASSLFKVTYKIGAVGQHFLCIMVGGEHIAGSPFCVQVGTTAPPSDRFSISPTMPG